MNRDAEPVAYIRRSVASRADPGDVSRDFQTEAVRKLAGDDAARLRIVDQDWGRSAATDKTGRRVAFLGLLDDIERGRVSALYAYSPDRLARSVEWSARLLNACRRSGVTITTTMGSVGPTDSGARAMFHVVAAMNENALDGMVAKAKATAETVRRRNIEAGRAPTAGMGARRYGDIRTTRTGARQGEGEDPQVVVAAFRAAGSLLGACKALNAAGVPTQKGRGGWTHKTVRVIVARTASELLPERPRRGSRTLARHRFSGLLRCHCGRTMTAMGRKHTYTAYFCAAGHVDPRHSRPYVISEHRLAPWMVREANRVRLPSAVEQVVATSTADAAALAERRRRISRLYLDQMVTTAEYEAEKAAIAAAEEQVERSTRVLAVPSRLDWTADPATVNAYLRTIWTAVELGPDLLPVRAVWAIPEAYIGPG